MYCNQTYTMVPRPSRKEHFYCNSDYLKYVISAMDIFTMDIQYEGVTL